MIVVTYDRGELEAKEIVFTPFGSHDMVVLWKDGSAEHMRRFEIISILDKK